ncbi:hypothetical protein KFK09_014688 [Dendrobium nobile]|uniref:Reverse transcriptase domain-containing protein n=1 Tax=Dendrobium nobile TaxID=94219 RepID=A0A8T3B2J0_DENNO|nr:hypothetical protein KFK09_014688 [Dendrobium nobile]
MQESSGGHLANSTSIDPTSVGAQNVIQYFQDLYNPVPPLLVDMSIFPLGAYILDHLICSLTASISIDEIKKAVFIGSPTSSPGPDGFNFHFYRSGWYIIGPLLIKVVYSFFTKGYMPRGVKSTALALIPKHKHASTISYFRLIALCNVLYKCIAKILANRLAPIMPIIVKANQAGFIKSRISTDNILLAKEILTYSTISGTKIF